jgi:hypothetical protein
LAQLSKHIKLLISPEESPFFKTGGSKMANNRLKKFYYPRLLISKARLNDDQALQFKVYYFGKVQKPIIKVTPNFSPRDIARSLLTPFSACSSGDNTYRIKSLACLISEMLYLSMPTMPMKEYILKYSSETKRDQLSGKRFNAAMGIISHRLLEVWEKLGKEDYPWSPGQIYLVNAIGNVFCRRIRCSIYAFPPIPLDWNRDLFKKEIGLRHSTWLITERPISLKEKW